MSYTVRAKSNWFRVRDLSSFLYHIKTHYPECITHTIGLRHVRIVSSCWMMHEDDDSEYFTLISVLRPFLQEDDVCAMWVESIYEQGIYIITNEASVFTSLDGLAHRERLRLTDTQDPEPLIPEEPLGRKILA